MALASARKFVAYGQVKIPGKVSLISQSYPDRLVVGNVRFQLLLTLAFLPFCNIRAQDFHQAV